LRLLLDTCTFLWIATDSNKLSRQAGAAFSDPANEVYLSAVSAWEVATKHALGKLALPQPPIRYLPAIRARHGISTLELNEDAVLHLSKLPPLHRDPFDRMLVCQAIAHGLDIVTPDAAIAQYPVRTLW